MRIKAMSLGEYRMLWVISIAANTVGMLSRDYTGDIALWRYRVMALSRYGAIALWCYRVMATDGAFRCLMVLSRVGDMLNIELYERLQHMYG
jgi:hypothetical protein